mmetsp:Transcript_33102/g.60709  ORF Transcript_33102/g.60709 Transcript_33102/m.60709 type:complete len:122 (-) Transcript_33102:20-385(-)
MGRIGGERSVCFPWNDGMACRETCTSTLPAKNAGGVEHKTATQLVYQIKVEVSLSLLAEKSPRRESIPKKTSLSHAGAVSKMNPALNKYNKTTLRIPYPLYYDFSTMTALRPHFVHHFDSP